LIAISTTPPAHLAANRSQIELYSVKYLIVCRLQVIVYADKLEVYLRRVGLNLEDLQNRLLPLLE
jgi:hypothetical protein